MAPSALNSHAYARTTPLPSIAGPLSMTRHTTAIILAAGLGTRMKSALPKVMHPIAGRPMIAHLLATLGSMGIDNVCAVISENMDVVADCVAPHAAAIQHEALGTGHAVLAARDVLGDLDGDVLVLFGADPLVTPQTLNRMLERRRSADNPAVVVLGFRPADPRLYGRLVTNSDGALEAIVEAKDASPEQLAIPLCNSGVMAIDGARLWSLLERVGNDNAKGEYYLTDIIALARADGHVCALVEGDAFELTGVDSRADLAQAEQIAQQRLRAAAMAGGASLRDPDTVYFSHDTALGRDVTIEPNVVFGTGVTIGDNVTIKAFSHLENSTIAPNVSIGPFVRLRGGTQIADGAYIGNFVEMKNADFGSGAKAAHLSYVGDSTVGTKANIGAGTITCNYDGFNKHRTEIGAGAFIGSNAALVAPVRIGDGAIIGAGSAITKDVDAGALAVTRAEQRSVGGWAEKLRKRMKKT